MKISTTVKRSTCRTATKLPGNITGQRGLTLIELMISIALSLVFIVGAMTFLVASRSLADVQDASSRAQENAQFALDEISKSIRLAGFYNLLSPGANIPVGQFYTGACGSYDPCTADSESTDAYPSDRIAILLNPPEDDGSDSDCAGVPVSTNAVVAANAVVAHSYRIEAVDGVRSFVCQSFLIDNAGNATAVNTEPYQLVPGIQAIQFLYGKTNITNIGQKRTVLQRYVPASTIDSLTPPAGASTAWVDIVGVKVALLASSGTDDSAATEIAITGKSTPRLSRSTMRGTDTMRQTITIRELGRSGRRAQSGMSLVVVLILVVALTTLSLTVSQDSSTQFNIVRNSQFYSNAYHAAYSEINAQLNVINSNDQTAVDDSILWLLAGEVNEPKLVPSTSLAGPHKGVGAFDQEVSFTLACDPTNCPSPPGYSLNKNTKVLRASIDSVADMPESGARH